MGGRSQKARSRGRKASTAAILDAAEALFAAREFSAVSVRDIAEAAGVSHALVHRYLGTKDDVFRAVLARREDVILKAAGDTSDLAEAARLMIREGLAHHQDYLRLLARSALGRVAFETTIRHFAASERLIELAERQAAVSGESPDDVGPRFTVIAAVALYLGWASMGDWLLRVARLEGVEQATVERELEQAIIDLLERVPGGPPGTDAGPASGRGAAETVRGGAEAE